MKQDTRQKMLDAAARLVQAHGFHGASLGDILERSKAPRGSLYFHFPGGKAQLVAEATRAIVDEITAQRAGFASQSRSAGELVRTIGDSIALVLEETDYTLSCPVSPLIFDGLDEARELAALSRDALNEWISILKDAFGSYGVPPDRVAPLALLVQSTFQGAALIALAMRDARVVRDATEQLAEMLEVGLATPKRRGKRST